MPGELARLKIFNGSSYRFKLTNIHSYQMAQWDKSFPSYIEPNQLYTAPIEYRNKILDTIKDDAGDVTYHLEKDHLLTEYSFKLEARANQGYYILARFINMKIQGLTDESKPRSETSSQANNIFNNINGNNNNNDNKNNKNSNNTLQLNDAILLITWVANGIMHFNLFDGVDGGDTQTGYGPYIPTNGWFNLTGQPPNWMTYHYNNNKSFGTMNFRQLVLPGSHDSGMYKASNVTRGVNTRNVVTQIYPIKYQLMMGCRYFDLRPVLYKNKLVCGHYTYNSILGWLGGIGEDLEDVINDINNFTSVPNNHELIILRLSHTYNVDNGFKSFTPKEWDIIFNTFGKLKWLLYSSYEYQTDLTQLPLSSFIDGQPCVIVILDNPSPIVSPGYGFFNEFRWPAYNNYSESNDNKYIIKDQLIKMYYNDNIQPFVLSWTSTQDTIQAILPGEQSIIQLASSLNEELYKVILASFRSPTTTTTTTTTTSPLLLQSNEIQDDDLTDIADNNNNHNDDKKLAIQEILQKFKKSQNILFSSTAKKPNINDNNNLINNTTNTIQLPSYNPTIIYCDVYNFNIMLYTTEMNRLSGAIAKTLPSYIYPYHNLLPSINDDEKTRNLTILCHNSLHNTKYQGIDWYDGIYLLGGINVQYYQLKSQHYDFRLSIDYNSVNHLKDIIYWLWLCMFVSDGYPIKEYTSNSTSLPLVIPLTTVWDSKILDSYDIKHLATIWKSKLPSVSGGDHTVVFIPMGCLNLFLQVYDNVLNGIGV